MPHGEQHGEQQPSTPQQPAVVAELRGLVQKAKAGDVSVLPRMRAILDGHPEISEMIGDLEKVVVRSWAELLGGDNPLSVESVRRKAEQLRAELEGDNPTPGPTARRAGGERVAGDEPRPAQGGGPGRLDAKPGGGCNVRRAEQAQKRHLAARKTLAAVRQLASRGLLLPGGGRPP